MPDRGDESPPLRQDEPFTVALDGELLRFGISGEISAAKLRAMGRDIRDAIDVTVLPYDLQTIAAAREARQSGRRTILAGDTRTTLVQEIADHLQIFDQIANTPPKKTPNANESFLGTAHNWMSALRLHQWIKNALIFVPLLAAHQSQNLHLIVNGIVAFFAFSLCASSVYILNDILDLNDDRHHQSKRHRAFASGRLGIQSGLAAFPVLLLVAFGSALLLLPWQFAVVLCCYYLLTLAYSIAIKRIMALDVIALAMLYTLRIFAGGAAFGLALTFWLLAFATFLFLSLALCKRYAEVRDALERGRTGKTRGRDYAASDLEMISSLGAAAGYQAVMVLALYIREQSTVALYANPELLWLTCPVLLFWITRVWMLTHRGQMHEDPVVFATRDWVSQFAGIVFLLIFLTAS
ncbi:MAG: UbiA family prenyltransferase [Micropepsaceae bacterium]